MTDSAFWADLAEKFKQLDSKSALYLDWQVDRRDDQSEAFYWFWIGGDTGTFAHDFDYLAEQAGDRTIALEDSQRINPDPIKTWLIKIKESSHRDTIRGSETLPDEIEGRPTEYWHRRSGTTERICLLSVRLCCKLQKQALEIEGRNVALEHAACKASVGSSDSKPSVMATSVDDLAPLSHATQVVESASKSEAISVGVQPDARTPDNGGGSAQDTDAGAASVSSTTTNNDAKKVRRRLKPKPSVLPLHGSVNKKQAAEALGVTPRTIERNPNLHPSKTHGKNRYPVKEIREILNGLGVRQAPTK